MSNSVWKNPEIQEAEKKEKTKSIFVSRLENGQSLVLKFTNLLHKEQDPSSRFPTSDGMIWEFWLVNKDGKEQSFTQNSTKGKFFQAMKKNNIEVGDIIKITKHLVEADFNGEVKMIPDWEIEKVTDWLDDESLYEKTKEFRKEETKIDNIPF